MIHRSRTMMFTAGAIFVIASGVGFGEDGSHPKTTQRIRIAFEALSATAKVLSDMTDKDGASMWQQSQPRFDLTPYRFSTASPCSTNHEVY